MLLEQCRTQFIEQGLDLASIAQSPLEQGHQFFGNVPTAPLAALGEGENESGMLITPGAGFAARAQAGLTDLGDGTFDGGPKLGELLQKKVFGIGMSGRGAAHEYGI